MVLRSGVLFIFVVTENAACGHTGHSGADANANGIFAAIENTLRLVSSGALFHSPHTHAHKRTNAHKLRAQTHTHSTRIHPTTQ